MKSILCIFILAFCAQASAWTLSAFSPYHEGKRVWIKINGKKIESISLANNLDKKVVYTDKVVFPGLIDLHGHLSYNVLPLWSKAEGQYNNRFEWRVDPAYKAYASKAMRVFRNKNNRPDLKDNILWAEMKAMTGGATSLLGAGGNAYHGFSFGIQNLENPSLYFETDNKVELSTDIVSKKFYDSIYVPYLKDDLLAGKTYEEAFVSFLKKSQIALWLDQYMTSEPTLTSALELIFQTSFLLEVTDENIDEVIKAQLKKPQAFKIRSKKQTVKSVKNFIYGSRRNPAYLEAPKTLEMARLFFSLDGNFNWHYSVRDFVYEYQNERQEFLTSEHNHTMVAHLSEGKHTDEFTQKEFFISDKLGFIKEGLVVIHGMGLAKEDLEKLQEKNISVVWSPLSNLLLYGESFDIPKFIESEVSLSLGTDWSVSGSKTLLDELKIAKKYLQQYGIDNDKLLVDMVTKNPAKAIKLDSFIGSIEEDKHANLILVDSLEPNFSALVDAQQKDISAVITDGTMIYGDKKLLEKYMVSDFNNKNNYLNRMPSENCSEKWMLLREDIGLSAINERLDSKLNKVTYDDIPLSADKIFNCEDLEYQNAISRFVN